MIAIRHGDIFTYVIKQVVIVWKIKASQEAMAEKIAPILVHNESNPMKKATTAKNKPMIMNGNINRDVKK